MAHAKEDSNAFYLHLVAAHGGTYMTHLGSPGKYMNSGLEGNHKMTNEMMTHTTNGGSPGTKSRKYKENGIVAYEKDAFEQKRIDEKKQVLERQNRDVWQDVKEFADLEWLRNDKTAEKVWPPAKEGIVWPTALLSTVKALEKEFKKSYTKDLKSAQMLDFSKKKMASAKSEPLALETFTKRNPTVQPSKKARR